MSLNLKGENVIIDPSIPEHELDERFPNDYDEVKPYLRYTAQPK